MSATTEETLAMMERYGGSFVRQLAALYRQGDEVNRQRLDAAFSDYFAQYGELAATLKRQQDALVTIPRI